MDFYGINVKSDLSVEGAPDFATSSSPIGKIYTTDLDIAGDITGTGTPDIGTSIARFGTIYATAVNTTGSSTVVDLEVTGDITGTGTPDIGTVGAPFGTFYGTATAALWGDLAEKYSTKEEYESGTVVCVSSDINVEVEKCNEHLSTSFIGIISTKPGYTMRNILVEGQYIALIGLVPVKIIGPINKGDFIVATYDGCAIVGVSGEIAYKIGVANETNLSEEVKLVNCIIK